MAKRISKSRLDQLAEQKAKLNQQLKEAAILFEQQHRKDQKRKAFLLGDLVLEKLEDNPKAYPELLQRLEKDLKSNRDRALFGLEILPQLNIARNLKIVSEETNKNVQGEHSIF